MMKIGIKRCFNLYVKFPKNRWKEIARAEKDDAEGNKILNFLHEEYLEKYDGLVLSSKIDNSGARLD